MSVPVSMVEIDMESRLRKVNLRRALPHDPWLAGFIDGEGCFTANGPNRPVFAIGLRWDDRAILEALQDVFGGYLFDDPRRNNDGANRQQAVKWQLKGYEQVLGIVDYLDRFPLRAKKAQQYDEWCREFKLGRYA